MIRGETRLGELTHWDAAHPGLAVTTTAGQPVHRNANGVSRIAKYESGPRPALRICVLGPLQVWRAGEDITPRSSGERTILALLALAAGGYVSAATMAEHLWRHGPRRGAENVVHTHVSRLRTRLEPGRTSRARDGIVASHQGMYRLCVEPDGLDLLEFRAHAARARAAGSVPDACLACEEALSLWRGEVVADIDVGTHPALTKIADEHLAVTLEHADLAGACGRHLTALSYLRNAAAGDPLHGAVHARLMLVLAGLGRYAEALRVFEDVRARLRDELGVGPDPVLRDAHARVLAHDVPVPEQAGQRFLYPSGYHGGNGGPASAVAPDPAARPGQAGCSHGPGVPADVAVPHQLPGRPAALVGRSAELAAITGHLTAAGSGTRAVVTVGGMPGVGKSALAIWAAHQASGSFPDGCLYADMGGAAAGAEPVATLDVLRIFLAALDPGHPVGHITEHEAIGRYRSLIAGRRLLVVLDGAASAAHARPLLPTGDTSAALITSRETLASLDATATVRVEPLGDSESARLLAHFVDNSRLQGAEYIATICRACEGLPLALRIVAAQFAGRPTWRAAEIAGRLKSEATRLASLCHGDLSLSTSLWASYESLRVGRSAADRDAARALLILGALAPADIDLGRAEALLEVPAWRGERALERLTDAHLLESPAPGRYRIHALLRLFAAALIKAELPAAHLESLRDRARQLGLAAPSLA